MGRSPGVWKTYIRLGKVRFGEMAELRPGRKQKIYRIDDVERLKEELFRADTVYLDRQSGRYHVPAEFARAGGMGEIRREHFHLGALEREGKINCGRRTGSVPKIYRVDDIQRLLDE